MTWYHSDDRRATDAEDESGVGLISSKSESSTGPSTEERKSRIAKSSLGVALVLSNFAWAGICLMLWRELHVLRIPARSSQEGFETDFGTATSLILPSHGDSAKHPK